MNLSTDNSGKEGLLCLEGDLTIQRASEIKNMLGEALQKTEILNIDISKATEFDLTLIQLLYSAAQSSGQMNKKFVLSEDMPEGFIELLRSSGYPEVYPFAEKKL